MSIYNLSSISELFIIETVLKLKDSKHVNISNMHLHDSKGHIKKYECAIDIIKEFYEIRLEYYHKRYKYLILHLFVMLKSLNYFFCQRLLDGSLTLSRY